MEREQADERRKWGVVHAPALQQARRELQALPARQERLTKAHHKSEKESGSANAYGATHPNDSDTVLDPHVPSPTNTGVWGSPDVVQIPERAEERGDDREQAEEREEQRDEPRRERRCPRVRGATRSGEVAGLGGSG